MEEEIQQTLIAAVETALTDGKCRQLSKLIGARTVHEDAGVETIWPANVGSSRQLLAFEKLVTVLQDLHMDFRFRLLVA